MAKKQNYRIRNWREYNEALRRRGSLTVWFDEQAARLEPDLLECRHPVPVDAEGGLSAAATGHEGAVGVIGQADGN
jgi:hypothetical protein